MQINDDEVRCPSCRGAKKVPKLGGMIGECNTCKGGGKIKTCDKVAVVIPVAAPITDAIVSEVARVVPIAVEIAEQVRIDSEVKVVEAIKPASNKKILYKRKKA